MTNRQIHSNIFQNLRTVGFSTVLTLLILLQTGCVKQDNVHLKKENVLILVLDACRPDKLGAYGYDKNTSPAIDSVASDPNAVMFHQHFVQGTETKPSTASLFTGLFVYQHGVTMGHKERPERGSRFYLAQVLSAKHSTLAEEFSAAGYYTFGVVKSYHLLPKYGFSQGFDTYIPPKEAPNDGERINAVIASIRKAKKPFFGYVHLNACHHPFTSIQRDSEFIKKYFIEYDEESRKKEGIDFTTAKIKKKINTNNLSLTKEDIAYLNLIYDAKLKRADGRVASLLQSLKRDGFYDNTLLIITADHGEELFEHKGYAHGHALWNEVVHVPLIVKYPSRIKPAGLNKHVYQPTQSIDIYPSLLSLLNREIPSQLPGRKSLLGEFGTFAFSETESEWALVKDSKKLIKDNQGSLLFNMESDQGEMKNLASDSPKTVEEMRKAYTTLRRAFPAFAQASTMETELDEEAIKALRSLGYIQ